MIYIYIMNHHDVFYPHHSTKRTSYYDTYLLDAHCHGMPLVYSVVKFNLTEHTGHELQDVSVRGSSGTPTSELE